MRSSLVIFRTGVVSNCTMGIFWGRCLIFIGYHDVAQETGSKLDPQNSPIMQLKTAPNQSLSCDRCLVPLA